MTVIHTLPAQANARMALTFDDGPDPQNTPALLDILAQRSLRATFFVIGTQAKTAPCIVQRLLEEGHSIGNHSWSHPHLDKLDDAAFLQEIDQTAEVLAQITGQAAPSLFRPPFGALTPRQTKMLEAERGLTSIYWSYNPQDYNQPGVDCLQSRILSHAAPGQIVLMHDVRAQTVEALPDVLDELIERGFDLDVPLEAVVRPV